MKLKRFMSLLLTVALIITAYVLQSAFSKFLGRNVPTPNLLLIVTCTFGYLRGENFGAVTGLVCGLLVDMFFGDIIGLCALLYMFLGFVSGLLRKLYYSERIIMPLVMIFFADFIYSTAYYVFRFLLRTRLDYSYYFWKFILPEMIITTFIMFLVYRGLFFINRKCYIPRQENSLSFDK